MSEEINKRIHLEVMKAGCWHEPEEYVVPQPYDGEKCVCGHGQDHHINAGERNVCGGGEWDGDLHSECGCPCDGFERKAQLPAVVGEKQ